MTDISRVPWSVGLGSQLEHQYRRFVELWRNGDLERGWVAQAQIKLERLTP